MKNDIYEKTESGYVLYQRKADVAVVIGCLLCYGLILPVDALIKYVKGVVQTISVWAIAAVFLACVILAVLFLRDEWCHMVIGEKGISFHRPLARTSFFRWEDLQDWGITTQRGRFGAVDVLYFSTEPLKPTHHGYRKKMPLTYRKAIHLRVDDEDLLAIQRAGILSFCRRHLGTVPMFASDLV